VIASIRLIAGWLALAALSAHAAFSGAILDAAGVKKAMAKGALVWDVRPSGKYFDGHIPGAVSLGDVGLALVDQDTQKLLPVQTIASRLGEAGIDLKREIVVYGAPASLNAYFVEWLLDYYGAKKVDVFHDGFEAWKAAGFRVATDDVKKKRVKVRPFANPSMWATKGEVVSRIGSDKTQFVDVRRFGEYNGDESDTKRSGHIPGAIFIPHDLALDSDGALRSTAELRKLYAKLDPHKETIVYDSTGPRAAMVAAILTKLGFRSVRVYYPGWIEYGNAPDVPVE